MRVRAGFVLLILSAWAGCGGPAAKPCVNKVEGDLVKSAAAFKLDVYGVGVHCDGNSVPPNSGQPLKSQTFVGQMPVRLDVPNGKRALVLTTFSDAAAATEPTGSACDEPDLEPGGTVCLNLQVTQYVRGCPADQKLCMSTCCAGGSCDANCNLTCSASFADCNHSLADGCETNLAATGQRLCNGNCIAPTACCDDRDCTSPNMTPVACYSEMGTCPSPGASCVYALKPTATICNGSTCCNAINGSCATDCTISCSGNQVDCNEDPADGCESNPPTDSNNCGACGRVCAATGTKHVNTSSGCNGGVCKYTCDAGWLDCNHGKIPDDGCECPAPACNPMCGCPITHPTGYTDTQGGMIAFFNCLSLNVYSPDEATAAANAYGAVFPGTVMPTMTFTDSMGTVDAVCLQTASDCVCWAWQAGGAYHPNTEGFAYKAATCTPPRNTNVAVTPGAVRWH